MNLSYRNIRAAMAADSTLASDAAQLYCGESDAEVQASADRAAAYLAEVRLARFASPRACSDFYMAHLERVALLPLVCLWYREDFRLRTLDAQDRAAARTNS